MSRGLSWTETPNLSSTLDCTCTADDRDCHALYEARVTAIDGNDVTLEFDKADGSSPSSTVHYWIAVQTDDYPSCTNNDIYAIRVEGSWPSSSSVMNVYDVPAWPSDTAFATADCGAKKKLHIMTGGGSGGHENDKLWFQYQAIELERTCD